MLGMYSKIHWPDLFMLGVTPADLLEASMAAELFSVYLQVAIGGTQSLHLSCRYSQYETKQPDALVTDLCWLGASIFALDLNPALQLIVSCSW